VIEGGVELVDCSWAERVAHRRAIKGDSHGGDIASTVVGDIVEGEIRDRLPAIRIEESRNHTGRWGGGDKKPADRCGC
jgi:hypothetical protein